MQTASKVFFSTFVYFCSVGIGFGAHRLQKTSTHKRTKPYARSKIMLVEVEYVLWAFGLVAVVAILLRIYGNVKVVSGGAVFVTGAGSGIGRAIVSRLDAAGFVVIAGVRQKAHAEEICGQHPSVRCVLVDVTVEADVKRAASEIQSYVTQRNTKLVGLINNAGIGFPAPLELSSGDQALNVFRVNVAAQIRVTNACLPMLLASKGRVVFVGRCVFAFSLKQKREIPGFF
jgi:hypothetical protein